VCLAWRATYILVDALRNVSLLVALIPFVLAASVPAMRPARDPSPD
jgi:hypothetical protein